MFQWLMVGGTLGQVPPTLESLMTMSKSRKAKSVATSKAPAKVGDESEPERKPPEKLGLCEAVLSLAASRHSPTSEAEPETETEAEAPETSRE